MQYRVKVFVAALVIALSSFAGAEEAADNVIDASVASHILTKLRQARPDFEYGEVSSSPIDGLYQVQVEGGPLLYVAKDGNFMLTGSLYGVVDGGFLDMQELALKPLRKAALDRLADADQIIFSPKGEVKSYIHVFTDVDCGYCRKLHQEVPELNAMGIEVRYLAYPRAGINSESYRKIATAWCAKDRLETMTRLKNRQPVDAKYCSDNPVAAQYELGNQLGVRGTPAIILPDGTMLPGYLPAKQLAMRLGL